MKIDIFSKRQKKLRGDTPDEYTYDDLPEPLRVQIFQIWMDILGGINEYNDKLNVQKTYHFIFRSLCHEYGEVQLSPTIRKQGGSLFDELYGFFLKEKNVERALDVVELSFNAIDSDTRSFEYLGRSDASDRADAAIDELNHRFKEHRVGYQYSPPQIVRMDSEFIHSEVVKPALGLLNQAHYAGAKQEFLEAYEYYRKENSKEALSCCLKAFESVMKAICDKRDWKYENSATSKSLIQICLKNELIPSYWQQHYTSLKSFLESGVPTGRNKLSGHGQGTKPTSVPNHLVAYMLHMTASTIVFLAEAEKNLS